MTRTVARLGVFLILILPIVLQLLSDEMRWSIGDFAMFTVLVLGTALTFELATRKSQSVAYRAAVGVALAASVLLIWLTGAVGIIGDEADQPNLMYVGALALGLTGTVFARGKPEGMSYAMAVTGLAVVVVGAIAVSLGFGAHSANWPYDILVLSLFFSGLYFISAWLFWRSAVAVRSVAMGDVRRPHV